MSDEERHDLEELEREYDGINEGFKIASEKLESIKNYLKEEKMVVYDSYNRYSAQIITHTQGLLLLSKLLEILEGET